MDGNAQQLQQLQQQQEEIQVEIPLITIREVFVYNVPPLKSSSGHRAEDWGLANPKFTGELKAVQVGDICNVRLYCPPKPEEIVRGRGGAVPSLFAQCPIRLDRGHSLNLFVEGVVDSSRYFVIRVEDEKSNRHAFVGIGFRERSSAFDFKAVLDDFVRSVHRQHQAEHMRQRSHEAGGGGGGGNEYDDDDGERGNDVGDGIQGDDAIAAKSKWDMSIQDGKKIHLKLGGNANSKKRERRKKDNSSSDVDDGGSGGGGGSGGLLLAPPPPGGIVYKPKAVLSTETSSQTQLPTLSGAVESNSDLPNPPSAPLNGDDEEEEDWGDFASA